MPSRAGNNEFVTTPSQRIWEHSDRLDDEPGLEGYLGAQPRDPATLVHVARRVAAGDELRAAVADFLDDLRLARGTSDVVNRISEEPPQVDPHTDAYLAAIAEHIGMRHEVAAPAWALSSSRFLDHFWWPTQVTGLRARTIVESPPAFRRRGIFIGATALTRV